MSKTNKVSPGSSRLFPVLLKALRDYVSLRFFGIRFKTGLIAIMIKYVFYLIAPLIITLGHMFLIKFGLCESDLYVHILSYVAAILIMGKLIKILHRKNRLEIDNFFSKNSDHLKNLKKKFNHNLQSAVEFTGGQPFFSRDMAEIVLPVTIVYPDREAPAVEAIQSNGERVNLPTSFYLFSGTKNGGLAVKVANILPWNQEKFHFSFNGKEIAVINPWFLTADMMPRVVFRLKATPVNDAPGSACSVRIRIFPRISFIPLIC